MVKPHPKAKYHGTKPEHVNYTVINGNSNTFFVNFTINITLMN